LVTTNSRNFSKIRSQIEIIVFRLIRHKAIKIFISGFVSAISGISFGKVRFATFTQKSRKPLRPQA
jgi:hypothetical protein